MVSLSEWRYALNQPDDYLSVKRYDEGAIVSIDTAELSPEALIAWKSWHYYMKEAPRGWQQKAAQAARIFQREVGVSPDGLLSMGESLQQKLNEWD